MKKETIKKNKFSLIHYTLHIMLSCFFVCSQAGVVYSAPQGANVVNGDVTITQNGSNTVINASNNAIINYQSFDIHPQETVQFVQPNASSRVLNRIPGSIPSHIDGSLLANGHVYISNPAGVYFGSGAFINVGGLVAAAGTITNADFINNIDHFTDINGKVVNSGSIEANLVNLVGREVINNGVILAEEGVISLVAGDDVLLGERDGHIFVKIENAAAAANAGSNTNSVNDTIPDTEDSGNDIISLGAGDMYSLAIRNTGTLKGKDITLEGGDNSQVNVSGTLDAAKPSQDGIGGTVNILGDDIRLTGATIDASGDNGGGMVLVGGDFQGQGKIRKATQTTVDKNTEINADANVNGDGGEVIVWSEDTTRFSGKISAKGGEEAGDGGLIETSGKNSLAVSGEVDASATNGSSGTWLLDPRNVTIDQMPTSGGAFDGNNPDTFTPTADDAIIDRDVIQASLNSGTNVTITTGADGAQVGDINMIASITKSAGGDATLTLDAANDISINEILSTAGALNIILNSGNRISFMGLTTNGGDITATSVSSSIGEILTNGGDITFNNSASSGISGALDAGSGNITIGVGGAGAGSSIILTDLVSTGTITINGGAGIDEIRIDSGSSPLIINGGAGNDEISAGPASPTLIINGGPGNDRIEGGTNDDVLDGGDGDDTVVASGDIDFTLRDDLLIGQGIDNLSNIEIAELTGGAGDNRLDASRFTGTAILSGEAGNDTLVVGSGGDTVDGGDGTDTVEAAGDVDFTLTNSSLTGLGADTLTNIEVANLSGGTGDNMFNVSGFSGSTVIFGNGGNDTIIVGSGDDTIDGGDGVDTVMATGDVDFILTDTLLTGLGNDSLANFEQANLSGGSGDNTIDASDFIGDATLFGGSGNDTLIVGSGNDFVDGGNDIDTVVATADVDFVITDSQLNGLGIDSLANIEQATLTGGDGNNSISSVQFTGSVNLSGGIGDDRFVIGSGNDTLDGGDGIDTVVAIANTNFTLTDSELTGLGSDTLANIEQAEITGGVGDNTLDASGFTGAATFSADAGNDTFIVGSGNDTFDGGDGTDTIVATEDVDFILTDSQLTGLGTDTLTNIERANITGGAGDNTMDAAGFSGIATLSGEAGNDTLLGGSNNDILDGGEGLDTVAATGDIDLTLTDSQLTGFGTDTLTNIEQANLIGGAGDNRLDASGFTGTTILSGGLGDDTLVVGNGNDSVDGGEGSDTIIAIGDVDLALTDSQLTGLGTDTLANIEQAILIGGIGDNILDAAGYSGIVTLQGDFGNDTLVVGTGNNTLDGGEGIDTLTATGDVDLILTDSQLTGLGTDTFANIEQVTLTGAPAIIFWTHPAFQELRPFQEAQEMIHWWSAPETLPWTAVREWIHWSPLAMLILP